MTTEYPFIAIRNAKSDPHNPAPTMMILLSIATFYLHNHFILQNYKMLATLYHITNNNHRF
jgi:hypothetical protein